MFNCSVKLCMQGTILRIINKKVKHKSQTSRDRKARKKGKKKERKRNAEQIELRK